MNAFRVWVSAFLAFVLSAFHAAIAAVPEGVTTALGDAKTDGLTIAGAVLVAIIALYAFKLMRKGL